MRETSQRERAHTGPYASRNAGPWTADEDARVRAMLNRPVQDLVEELGWSPAAIDTRRSRLRRQRR